VVPDERRESNLAGWVARRLAKGEFKALPTVLVAARDIVYRDVLGSISSKPGQERRVRLVD